MMRRLDSLTDSMDMNLSKLRETEEEDRRGQKRTEEPGMLQSMGSQRVEQVLVTESLCCTPETNMTLLIYYVVIVLLLSHV